MNKILWLITARSGSKSIPGKNIKNLAGRPLLAYRVLSALAIAKPEDVWISTDSKEYADIAKNLGAKAPFLRPPELATDTASSIDVVLHAMDFAEKSGKRYDVLALLEPTSPFITSRQLSDAANQLIKNPNAENIVAVRNVRPSSFVVQEKSEYLDVLARRFSEQKISRRQEEKEEITPSGGFYMAKWEQFRKNKDFYTEKTLAYLVPDINALEIDEPMDWVWAEFLFKENLISENEICKSFGNP